MSEQQPEAPGPDTETDAGDVDQDSEPPTAAPVGGAPNDPSTDRDDDAGAS